jgi:hypothetical protein
MFNSSKLSPDFPIFHHFWKPAAVTSTGDTASAIWFEENLMFGEEILALVFLTIVGGLMYLFNVYIFKGHMPRCEDIENAKEKRRKK